MEALSLSTCLTVVSILLPTTLGVWSLGEHHSGMNVTKGRGVHRRDDRDKAVSQSGRQTNGSDWKAVSQSGRQTNGSDWKADRVTSVHQSLLQTRDLLHESEHGGSPALYTWEKGKQTAEEFLHNYCFHECFHEQHNIYSPDSLDINLADPVMSTRALLIKPTALNCLSVVCFACYCKQTFPNGEFMPDIPIYSYDSIYSYHGFPKWPFPKMPVEGSVSETPTTRGTASDGKETEQKTDRDCVMGNCCPKRPPSDF